MYVILSTYLSLSLRILCMHVNRVYKARVAAAEAEKEKVEVLEVAKPSEKKEQASAIEVHDIGR